MSYKNKPVIAIVQARTQSQRLPGKVLMDLAGRPSILYVMERAKRSLLVDKVILATSVQDTDDQLAMTVKNAGMNVFRGPEDDVLSRFEKCLRAQETDYEIVIRVCADNFLVCPEIIDETIKTLVDSDYDFVNPFLDSTYPFGAGVEATWAKNIYQLDSQTKTLDSKYREHVLLYAYEKPEVYRFTTLQAPLHMARPQLKISVDTKEDFVRVEKFFTHCTSYDQRIHANLSEIVAFYDDKNGMHFRPVDIKDSALLLKWRNDPLTRKNSLQTAEVTKDEHAKWLATSLEKVSRKIYIVEEAGLPIGTLRTDSDAIKTELSWTVAPEARGRGIGKKIVSEAVNRLRGTRLWAKIKNTNAASIRVAETAGFSKLHATEALSYFWANKKPSICVYAKGSATYGWGHIRRSTLFVQKLQQTNQFSKVWHFLEAEDNHNNFQKFLQKVRPDFLFYDLLEVPSYLLEIGSRCSHRIGIFNDIGNYYSVGDLFIQSQVLEVYPELKEKRTLSGPEYFLISDMFFQLPTKVPAPVVKNILIVLGGTLPERYLQKLEELIAALSHFKVFLASGFQAKQLPTKFLSFKNLKIIEDPEQLPNIMTNTDIALAASGFVKYELAALGIPTLLVSIAEHQEVLGRVYSEKSGAAIYLGRFDDINIAEIIKNISSLAEEYKKRSEMATAGKQLVDGKAFQRVLTALWELLFS